MIEISGLSAGYPGREVLSGIELTFSAGEVSVIAGPNGCGKSTLLKVLAGILPRSGGQLLIGGRDIASYSGRELARTVAYLAQSRQTPDITVQRMVLHGRFPYLSYPRRYGREDLAIAHRAMEQMGIQTLADQPVALLSGGQRQKVYIAMALAQATPVILLDEPNAFLDVAHQLQMMRQARILAESGKAVVLVLHDLPMALQAADRLVVLSGGRVAQAAEPEQVFASGCLDDVFGVTVRRVETPEGWQYYFRTSVER